MRIRCSSAYLRRVALPLAGTPPFRRYGIVLEEAKGEPQGTGHCEGKERKKKKQKPVVCSKDLLATHGNLSRALDGEGPPRMRSKFRLQPLAPPSNGPCA